jgi:sensor histidine kinase YesM
MPGRGERVEEVLGLNLNVLFYIVGGLIFVVFYSMIAAVSVAFKMTATWYATENARKELERSRSEAELQNLKSQLNPHFLFNTLNNIYSLIALSPERAQEAVHDLSRLLRYVMYESSQPYVTLEKDLDFVRNYVELMRIRLPEHVELKTNISSVVPGTLIAPLLFISLIENAFKHGVSNNKPSFIHIDITQEGNQVICSITNSDFHKDASQDKSGSGIGLVNLDRRLALLYPNKHVYTYGPEGDTYRSYLSITIND